MISLKCKDRNRVGRIVKEDAMTVGRSLGWVFSSCTQNAGVNRQGNIGLGCIIRDCQGKVVLAISKCEEVRWPTEIAQGRALILGFRQAVNRRIKPLIVESNCKKIIESSRKKDVYRSELGNILEDIYKLEMMTDVRDWVFTFREANSAAHLLTHFISPVSYEHVCVDCSPLCIAGLVAQEAC